MALTWHKTKFPGIRYREHAERRHGSGPDRYFSIRYYADGRRVENGLGWASEGWTIEKANNLRAELSKARVTGDGPRTLQERRAVKAAERKQLAEQERLNITFAEAAALFLEWGKLNKKDWRHDEARLRHLLPLLGKKRLAKITRSDLEDVKEHVQRQGFANGTLRHCLTLARSVFNHAADRGHFIGQNPVKAVIRRTPKEDNRRTRFFSYEEAEALLSALKGRSRDTYDQALLSLYAGLRAGEIFSLRWDHVDLEHGLLNVMESHGGKTKSGETRVAFLTDNLKEMLASRLEYVEDKRGLVFTRRDGGPYEDVSVTFYRTVRDMGFNEGITDRRQKVCFHSCRHTFASWLALQGTPLLTIKELMGHRTIEMTMRYAHLIPDQKRKAVETLAARAGAAGKVVPLRRSEGGAS